MESRDVILEDVIADLGGHRVLHAVSARLPAECLTALAGDNGSGKSTLIEVLAGVVPYAGRIHGLPARRALVVQRTQAGDRLPVTARAVVAMGLWHERGVLGRLRRVDHDRVDAALETVGLSHLGHRQLGELSEGQRHRVLVAQGLVQDAPLTLFDEPTASADRASRDRIDTAMLELAARGRTVLVATHDRSTLAVARHAILLDSGRVVAEGAPHDIAAEQARRASAALALGDGRGRAAYATSSEPDHRPPTLSTSHNPRIGTRS